MQHTVLIVTALAGLAAAQKTRVATINRDEIEYKSNTPCPIGYVKLVNPRPALESRLNEGYKICVKGNIANCAQGSSFYMDERNRGKCQLCRCDTAQGGLYTAHCNKIDCKDLPKSTPTPGKGPLKGRGVRQNCGRTKPKVCEQGCAYMARYRNCVYCDCTNKVDFNQPQFQV